jgi:selenide, water dikinase
VSTDPNLMVGLETADDAGVYRIGERCALVETVDIITPLVDDPFTFGRIAAANALSDVYAMGGRPVTAMNLVFFPTCALSGEVLRAILKGGAESLREAGCCLVGGHTVEDDELKYGLSVTGLIDPATVVRNSTARPGDRLILTKPLGTGIVSTAIKGELCPAALETEAIRWMTLLNDRASRLMLRCGASAATDVTGFGLAGHALEMARGAQVTIRIQMDTVPLFPGLGELIADGLVPAGCYRNRDHVVPHVAGNGGDDRYLPLYDPQTSGGLLIALAPEQATEFLRLAAEEGLFAVEIGQVFHFFGHLLEFM